MDSYLRERKTVTIAAIQARHITFVSPAAWARAREPLVAEAAARGAVIAVLAGRPGWDEISDEAVAAAAELAARYRMHLVADLGFERDDQMRAYAAASVISPKGVWLGSQRQVHLSADGLALLLSPGAAWKPVPTSVAKLGILLGDDVLDLDAGRVLTRMGADILVHLGELRDASTAQCRIRRVVEATGAPGIEAYPAGSGLMGRSCVLVPGKVLAQASDPASEAVIVAALG